MKSYILGILLGLLFALAIFLLATGAIRLPIDLILGIFFAIAGSHTLASAYFDWDTTEYSFKASFYIKIIGRRGVRILNAVGGIFLLVAGLWKIIGELNF